MSTTTSPVNRVMVATDRSETADRAVRWAANVAAAYGEELLLLQVLPAGDGVPEVALSLADEELRRFAEELAGGRGWSPGKIPRRRSSTPSTQKGWTWSSSATWA